MDSKIDALCDALDSALSREKMALAEIDRLKTEGLREERDQFQIERDRARQIACDLASALRQCPVRCAIDPEVWKKAQLAIKEVDLGRGAGERYEWPR